MFIGENMDVITAVSALFIFGIIIVVILVIIMFYELFEREPDLFHY